MKSGGLLERRGHIVTAPRKPSSGDFRLWQCKTCAADIGVATSSAVDYYYTIFVNVATGKPSKRHAGKKLVCAYCLGRGKVTDIF